MPRPAFTEGPYSREAKLYWQAGDPTAAAAQARPRQLGGPATARGGSGAGVSRARPATAAAASLAPNVLIKDWYYKFQPGPAADAAPRRRRAVPLFNRTART